jgi:predicted porin
MKHHHQFTKLSILALLSASFGANAIAQDASTEAQINALKSQIGQLTQKVNDLGARQQQTSSSTDTTSPGIRARYKDIDVRLFGSLDVYYENQNTGKDNINRIVSSGSGYSQLGFSATKQLSPETSIFGDTRLSYQPDNGKTNSTSRTFNSVIVGAANDRFGTLQVGRQGTQMGEALASFRLIRLGTANFIYNPVNTLTHDNMVKYISPKFGNFQASGNIDFSESTTQPSRGTGAMLKYDNGQTMVLGGISKSNAALDNITSNDTVSVTSLGVTHDLGFMKPFIVAQNVKSNRDLNKIDLNTLYYGIDVPVGPGTLRVEGETLRNKSLANANARSMSLRYDWKLDSNITLYFVAAKIKNEANVYYPIVGTGGFGAVAPGTSAAATAPTTQNNSTLNTAYNGVSPRTFAVGIKIDF